ncbi:low-density lipoprotein receptor-related protein 2-like isoform X2 [Ostrea edulis]|uniref:low-density lipoprotein receptor-related protein 2-like isoform X2 n=1 Tax=Ostrea edulis TaxID=37623 RepID=UPI0024AFD348|nr:low-density lipoprotein receptor-related protein 2-like isoform X2 [Ostrea edulis]
MCERWVLFLWISCQIICIISGFCDYYEFTCDNGKCIDWLRRCDVIDDCGDGSDEKDGMCNRCTSSQHKCHFDGSCVRKSNICNGNKDCSDWSDETPSLCGGDCSYAPNMFQCDNNRCVYQNLKCNGRNDCFDWSDEVGCSCIGDNKFKCFNDKCIYSNLTCDGSNDCGDYSDEIDKKCHKPCYFASTCNNGRCFPPSYRCDGDNDCRDFSDESHCSTCQKNQFMCRRTRTCIPSSWRCNGVSDCQYGEDEVDCTCSNPNDFKCGSGECVEYASLCDGVSNCADSSDEKLCYPSIKVIPGKYGPRHYDCHCNGNCHPGTGACLNTCKRGWAGPTCQIRVVPFHMPIQNSGHKAISSPLSIDGDVRTCPPPAASPVSAGYWEANITRSVNIRRIRIYNPKDVRFISRLDVPWSPCNVNDTNRVSEGYVDIICSPGTKLRHLLVLQTPGEGNTFMIMQICEIQIVACSNHSFGGQCEKTCNCQGAAGCDDVTGNCLGRCLSGLHGRDCPENVYTGPLTQLTSTTPITDDGSLNQLNTIAPIKDDDGWSKYWWISLIAVAVIVFISFAVILLHSRLRQRKPESQRRPQEQTHVNRRISGQTSGEIVVGIIEVQFDDIKNHVRPTYGRPPIGRPLT